MITPKPPSTKIAIIGAGISGLRCAHILLNAGFSVTIFEARHEPGGRTRQVTLHNGTHAVDIGANWIHGYSNPSNPIAKIQKQIGTIVYDFDRSSIRYDEQGRMMSKKEVLADSKVAWPAFERFMKESALRSKEIDPELSWVDGIREQLKEVTDDPVTTARLLRTVEQAGGFPGEGIDQLSYRYAFMEDFTDALRDDDSEEASTPSNGEDDEPDNVFVAGTYRDIVQHIARPALEKATLHFNTEIVSITSTSSPNPSSQGQPSHAVQLRTKAGATHTFDDVVLTTPLGWLKQHNSLIHPPLPSPILNAINDLSFGRLEKCYIAFPRAWWHDTPVSPDNIVNLTNDLHLSTNTDSNTNTNTNTNTSKSGSKAQWSEATFLNPSPYHPYALASSSSYPFAFLTLCSLPGPHSHPTLLLYLFGDAGAKITSLLAPFPLSTSPSRPTPQHILDERQKILRYFYEPLYSRLPGYDASKSECRPSEIDQTEHQRDGLQGGSYTCSCVGTEDALGSLAVLSGSEEGEDGGKGGSVMQSMGEGRGVWLAGEHCAGAEWVATTVGAYVSGERVGGWIKEKYI